MRRSLLVMPVLVVLVFSIGYVVGQGRSHSTPSAAAATENLAVSNMSATDPTVRPSWTHPFSGTRIFGRIEKISGDLVTVSLPNHFFGLGGHAPINQIQITANTKLYTRHGVSKAATTLKVGSFLAATGTLASHNTVMRATYVLVFSEPRMATGPNRLSPEIPAVTGKVTAISGNTLPISSNIGWWTRPSTVNRVVETTGTHYFSGPFQVASRSSVHVGSIVSVRGAVSSNGKTITASTVTVAPAMPHIVRPGMFGIRGSLRLPRLPGLFQHRLVEGKVTAIVVSNPQVLTVQSPAFFKTSDSLVHVDMTNKTQYVSGLDTKASVDSVKVGSYILASGTTSNTGNVLTASTVRVLPSPGSIARSLRGLRLHMFGLRGLGLHGFPVRWSLHVAKPIQPFS